VHLAYALSNVIKPTSTDNRCHFSKFKFMDFEPGKLSCNIIKSTRRCWRCMYVCVRRIGTRESEMNSPSQTTFMIIKRVSVSRSLKHTRARAHAQRQEPLSHKRSAGPAVITTLVVIEYLMWFLMHAVNRSKEAGGRSALLRCETALQGRKPLPKRERERERAREREVRT